RNSSPWPETAWKTSSPASSSSRKTELAWAPKIARATSTTDWRSSSAIGSRDVLAGCTSRDTAAPLLVDVGGGRVERALQLEGRHGGALGEDPGAQAGDEGRGEAVAGGADGAAAQPGDLHVLAGGEELHGRTGVVQVQSGVVLRVAAHRDHRCEAPGEAL